MSAHPLHIEDIHPSLWRAKKNGRAEGISVDIVKRKGLVIAGPTPVFLSTFGRPSKLTRVVEREVALVARAAV